MYKLSKNTYMFNEEEKYFIFNRINLLVLECDKELFDLMKNSLFEKIKKTEKEIFDYLTQNRFIVNKSDNKDSSKIKNKISNSKININSYRLLLTNNCNYACKYCFVNRNKEDITWDSIKKSLNLLIKNNKSKKIIIQFFGGEPLLKFDLIKKAVEYLKEKNQECHYVITTNGSLITEEKAKFFNKNNFKVGVSIDGPKEMNDNNRVTPNEKGTYDITIKGFKLLKKNNVNNFILLTPSKNNIDVLDELAEFVIRELKPKSITINMPQHNYSWGIDGIMFSNKMKKILRLCIDNNVNLTSPVSQIINALKDKTPVLKTCSNTFDNATVSITPDGRVSYCTINYSKKLFNKKVDEIKDFDYDEIQSWFRRTGLNHKKCADCMALTVCGGVCPMQSIMKHPDKKELICDEQKCIFFNDFLTWAIKNL